MWFTVELLGRTVLAVGVGSRPGERWITNTDGSFELAPQEVEEYDEEYEEEYRLGFH